MKASRTTGKPRRTVFHDSLLSASLVVEDGTKLYLVPNSRGGWHRRVPLKLTAEAKAGRLSPAHHITMKWLEAKS